MGCRYRMEGRSAVPDYDFIATSGELVFGPGEDRAFVPVRLLPKRLGEHSDQFQIIIEAMGGGGGRSGERVEACAGLMLPDATSHR